MSERIREKLQILADATKYDVSCSSSGSNLKVTNKDLGDANGAGICHTHTEDLYGLLWNGYFKSTNIPARKNMKLHIRHVPKRYWKYLTEKYGSNDNQHPPPPMTVLVASPRIELGSKV